MSVKFETRNPGEASRRDQFETKVLNPKLEILNSKQTQMSKVKNLIPCELEKFDSMVEKSELPFEFYILDLFRV